MPKQTFFNLPEDKKGKIMEAARNEFSEYRFMKHLFQILSRKQVYQGEAFISILWIKRMLFSLL